MYFLGRKRNFENISHLFKKLSIDHEGRNEKRDDKVDVNENDEKKSRQQNLEILPTNIQSQLLSLNNDNNTENRDNFDTKTVMRCGEIISDWFNISIHSSQQPSPINGTILSINEVKKNKILSMLKKLSTNNKESEFSANINRPCHCSLTLCIPWYVCGIRYCPDSNELIRCGVHTCRKRFQFRFAVSNKMSCLSDFDPTISSLFNNDFNADYYSSNIAAIKSQKETLIQI